MLILIGGGVRCGKSTFALALARRLGKRRGYIATAQARDDEMALRIERHIQERGADFRTIEAPINVVEALAAAGNVDVVVLDCLTLWLANLLLRSDALSEILRQVDRFIETARSKNFHTIVVTNEVGMGIVPETPLGRDFRDLCGRAHQALSARSDEVYFGALGTLIRLKPGPLAIVTSEEVSR